ncbi:F-box protein At4g00893-like [Mercurialis annua]|uniref:F-box protein At4g00893-like n=1 Tax=Mercurialis annua TaxID=3986 RepID=UPI0024AC85BE|nr:F-box protein At4g00893-like [Mercurialis annua]
MNDDDAAKKLFHNTEEEETEWSKLPPELEIKIFSHLFDIDAGAVGVIRSTCKTWSLIDSVSRFSQLPMSDHQYPLLVELKYDTCIFYHSIYGYSFQQQFSELAGAFILSSKFDWLLLSRMNCSLFFFNPFTREKINLPPYSFEDEDQEQDFEDEEDEEEEEEEFYIRFTNVAFSAPPTSEECYVIGTLQDWPFHYYAKFYILKVGWTDWLNLDIPVDIRFELSRCQPIVDEGTCYCLAKGGRLILIDFKKRDYSFAGESFSEFLFDNSIFPEDLLVEDFLVDIHRTYLVKHDEEIFCVLVTHGQNNIYVKRMNLSEKTKSWRNVDNLDRKMLFLSYETSFLKLGSASGTNNKIYFPKLHQNQPVFFSLSTRKYHSFSGNYSNRLPYDIRELRNCTWIQSCNRLYKK